MNVASDLLGYLWGQVVMRVAPIQGHTSQDVPELEFSRDPEPQNQEPKDANLKEIARATPSKNRASYIKAKDYGVLPFEFFPCEKTGKVPALADNKGNRYSLSDSEKHVFVFGGSGSGKTFYTLNQWLEAFFVSTHLSPQDKREQLKIGGLIVEAKGDFRDKVVFLGKKYQRPEDILLFGPSNPDFKYNFFGDNTELPVQRADKMVQLMKAYQGGKGTDDPFWDSSASKLFSNIFAMHADLVRAAAAAPEEEKEQFAVPPMSFHLLSLMLMDRGEARNQSEVNASASQRQEISVAYREYCDSLSTLCVQLTADFEKLSSRAKVAQATAQRHALALDEASAWDLSDAEAFAKFELLQESAIQSGEDAGMLADCAADFEMEVEEAGSTSGSFIAGNIAPREALDQLSLLLEQQATAQDDQKRAQLSNKTAPLAWALRDGLKVRVGLIDYLGLEEVRGRCLHFIDVAEKASAARRRLISMRAPVPFYGMLKQMIGKYEKLLNAYGTEYESDLTWAYFNGDYLAEANAKTNGSVAMVASIVVDMFTKPPFNAIFTEDGTFNFGEVIDKGQIVYLDMPTAVYQIVASVASLALKMDYFRAVLMRKRLKIPDGSRLVNQDRQLMYFCDEFASVASTGPNTGEAGFMDKCREFHCSCVLGAQSFTGLAGRLPENEILSILSNTATTIFLRNPDEKTNELASKRAGLREKVQINFSSGATEVMFSENANKNRGYSTSYQKAPRFEPEVFTKLLDGECVICMPPRFGEQSIQRLRFKGRVIENPDSE